MEGLETAPLTLEDVPEVARVWRAAELHDDGEALFVEEDFVAAARQPSMELARHSVGVRDGGELVALGMLHGERQVFAAVDPERRGRGIGAWLLRWSEDAARAAGHERVTQSLSENEHAAKALLEASGYEARWEGWIFEIEVDREPASPALPAGYAFRDFDRARDGEAVHQVVNRAFGEWPDPEDWPFGDWEAETLDRPGFVPEHVATVVHGDAVVGAATLLEDDNGLWVAQLAVDREHRGRGLARALLVRSFATAWRAGLRNVGLATDSKTGARGLYERVGMRVKRSFWEYEKSLR